MASFASQLWQLRKPTTNRNDDVNANGSIDQSAPMDGQESVLYSDPFSNAVPVIDPFSGDALKNDLFKALAGAPVLNANHQANDGFDQSLESTNPFTKPSDQVISKALIQANDYRSEDIPGGMKCEDSDFSDLCHIGDKEVVSISSKMTTSTLSNATSWSKQHFSSLDASMVSSFGDMSSSAPTSNSAKTSALTSNPQSSSSATVLISGSSDNEQLLSCELRSMVNSTFEVDSGHSTETVPSCVYRELVDETDAEPNTSHNEGPLPDQEDNPEKQATGVLQVPQILFTEATLLSSEGSSFEAVRTTEGVGEGRTYLLESITAEDETSITKDERCYKPSKVIVFKATESDEEIAGEGDASIDKEDPNGARHIDYETLETQLDVSGNHQNRIMNLSDIEPSDGTEKTHEFESPTLDSEYRRRSAPNEFFPNGEVDLTDLDCLTKTCSVGDLNKGDNCLNIVEQPKVLTSSPIASRKKTTGNDQMQPLQLWRKEFHQRIAFLDAQEQKAIEELKMEAQRCRDKWYASRQEEIRVQHAAHIENESRVRSLADGDRQDPKSIWNSMTSLALELQRTHKADEVNRDVSRMKSLMQLLKLRPPLQNFKFACASRK